jgi:hypothetical protein
MARIEELEIEMQQLRIEVRFDTKIQYMIVLQSRRCLLSLKALYFRGFKILYLLENEFNLNFQSFDRMAAK